MPEKLMFRLLRPLGRDSASPGARQIRGGWRSRLCRKRRCFVRDPGTVCGCRGPRTAVPEGGGEHCSPTHPSPAHACTCVHTHTPLTAAQSRLCWSRPHVSGWVAGQGPPGLPVPRRGPPLQLGFQTQQGGGGRSTEFHSCGPCRPHPTPPPPRLSDSTGEAGGPGLGHLHPGVRGSLSTPTIRPRGSGSSQGLPPTKTPLLSAALTLVSLASVPRSTGLPTATPGCPAPSPAWVMASRTPRLMCP